MSLLGNALFLFLNFIGAPDLYSARLKFNLKFGAVAADFKLFEHQRLFKIALTLAMTVL